MTGLTGAEYLNNTALNQIMSDALEQSGGTYGRSHPFHSPTRPPTHALVSIDRLRPHHAVPHEPD